MSDQPKILWHSNAPWSPTGYGQQTALFVKELADDDYQIAVSSFYGLDGNVIPWHGIPVLPGLGRSHGNETIRDHAQRVFGEPRGGLTMSLMDVWVLDPKVWGQLNFMAWAPVDHDPCPPPIAQFFHASGAIPLAMSRFGARKFEDAGLKPSYCPHAIDTSIFKPKPKVQAREELGMEQDVFWIGVIAANVGSNPSRKAFPELYRAFAQFAKLHDDVRMYVHAEVTGIQDGINLLNLGNSLEIEPELIAYPDQYRPVYQPYPQERMATMYAALDVLLAPSMGEGFGIPTVEAQACGTPVIVSDFAASTELCGAGWLIEGDPFYTNLKAWQITPRVPDIVDALRQAYNNAGNDQLKMKARKFAESYELRRVYRDFMKPAIEGAMDRFGEAPEKAKVSAR